MKKFIPLLPLYQTLIIIIIDIQICALPLAIIIKKIKKNSNNNLKIKHEKNSSSSNSSNNNNKNSVERKIVTRSNAVKIKNEIQINNPSALNNHNNSNRSSRTIASHKIPMKKKMVKIEKNITTSLPHSPLPPPTFTPSSITADRGGGNKTSRPTSIPKKKKNFVQKKETIPTKKSMKPFSQNHQIKLNHKVNFMLSFFFFSLSILVARERGKVLLIVEKNDCMVKVG